MNYLDQSVVFLFVLFAPIVLGLVAMLNGADQQKNLRVYQKITLLNLLAVCCLPVLIAGQNITFPWFESVGINFSFYLDSLSFVLIIFSSLIFLLYSIVAKADKASYFFFLLLLQFALFGVFSARNLVVFYLFYELLLLPVFYLMYLRGDDTSKKAAFQFLLYTAFGSLLMLVAIAYCGMASYEQLGQISFEFTKVASLEFPVAVEKLLMLAFFVAFAIKAPVFPFHAWLPAAYTAMPHRSAIVITALLFQAGVYGIFRFVIFLFPAAYLEFTPIVATLATIGIIYASLIAWRQKTIRGLLAYASIAHVGFSVLGLSLVNTAGIEGGLILIVSHILIAAGLFALASFLIERTGSEEMSDYSGLAVSAPRIAIYLVTFSLAAISLPLTLGFIGEFKVLAAAFQEFPYLSIVALLGVILGAVYMLKLCAEILYGQPNELSKVKDLSMNENAFLAALLCLLVFLGVFPGYVISLVQPQAVDAVETFRSQQVREFRGQQESLQASASANQKNQNFILKASY